MVFPIVMYGYESWTIKKAECQRIDAFELWCWRRLLRVPLIARRSNQTHLTGDRSFTVNCKMISGAGLIMTNKPPNQKLPLSAEPKPKIHLWASCSLAFSSKKFLNQHVKCNHPSQILLKTSARDRLQPEDPCASNQNQQQHYSDPHIWSDKPESREAKEKPQSLLKSLRLRRISRASSYSFKGQMGCSRVHKRMREETNTGQEVNPEDTGKLFMGKGASRIMSQVWKLWARLNG